MRRFLFQHQKNTHLVSGCNYQRQHQLSEPLRKKTNPITKTSIVDRFIEKNPKIKPIDQREKHQCVGFQKRNVKRINDRNAGQSVFSTKKV